MADGYAADHVVEFTHGGEKLGLLVDYHVLHRMETVHGYMLADLWEALGKSSAKAIPATLFEALERHRTQVAQRVRKWTIEDAQMIYMALTPPKAGRLATDAVARACIPAQTEAANADTGKAEPPAGSTGTPSS